MAAMKRFFFKEMVKNRTRIDGVVEEVRPEEERVWQAFTIFIFSGKIVRAE